VFLKLSEILQLNILTAQFRRVLRHVTQSIFKISLAPVV